MKNIIKLYQKKYLIINKSNFCFNLIFLIEISSLGFRTYFEFTQLKIILLHSHDLSVNLYIWTSIFSLKTF